MYTHKKELFIGRTVEQKTFKDLLAKPKTAILSVSGAGGIGKLGCSTRVMDEATQAQGFNSSLTVIGIFDFSSTRYQFLYSLMLNITRGLDPQFYIRLVEAVSAAGLGRGLAPKDEVTKIFFEGYEELAKRRQIVLFFDTFEALDAWTRFDFQHFLAPRLPKTLSVVAGRDKSITQPANFTPERFIRIELGGLTVTEAQDYFQDRGMSAVETDNKQMKQLIKLSGGQPIFLALAADWIFEHFDLDPILRTPRVSSPVLCSVYTLSVDRKGDRGVSGLRSQGVEQRVTRTFD